MARRETAGSGDRAGALPRVTAAVGGVSGRVAAAVAGALLMIGLAGPAKAGSVLDKIRAERVLQCGAMERPGIAADSAGLAVDLCRAAAIALIGPDARISFRFYNAPEHFDPDGGDQLAFLTAAEITEQKLGIAAQVGQPVARMPLSVMVPEASAMESLEDLSARVVCFMISSDAHLALEETAGRRNIAIARLGFEEDVELLDAYNAGHCEAVAAEAGVLGEMRGDPGVRNLKSRILSEPVGAAVFLAVTPAADPEFSSAVETVFASLIAGQDAANEALRPDWRQMTTTALGTYDAMIERDLASPLGLAADLFRP